MVITCIELPSRYCHGEDECGLLKYSYYVDLVALSNTRICYWVSKHIQEDFLSKWPNPVAVRYKAWVCDRSLARFVISNLIGGINPLALELDIYSLAHHLYKL